MRPDSIAEGMRWLERARHDLRWTVHLAQEGGYHIACFLAQQVTEKALKAILYARGEETVLGHSVQRLGADVAVHAPEIGEAARRWAVLDGYYIPTRYPNGLPDSIPALVFTQEAASGAVALAGEAVDAAGGYFESVNDGSSAERAGGTAAGK